MTQKHTPGPWEASADLDKDGFENLEIKAHGKTIISGCGCCGSPFGDNAADIPLFAAAPDLLEAATAMRDHLDKWQETGDIATAEESKTLYDALSAAIAKAEGRE